MVLLDDVIQIATGSNLDVSPTALLVPTKLRRTAARQTAVECDFTRPYVLSQHACEPLDCEIERIESVLASHVWTRRQQEAHA